MWPFKKKPEEERDLGLGPENRTGLDTTKEEVYDRLGPENTPKLQQESFEAQKDLNASMQSQQNIQSHDMQIISAKLDTIKSMLELVNQKLITLEKNNEEREKKKLW